VDHLLCSVKGLIDLGLRNARSARNAVDGPIGTDGSTVRCHGYIVGSARGAATCSFLRRNDIGDTLQQMKRMSINPIAVLIAGFAAGIASTYVFFRRRSEEEIEQVATEMFDEILWDIELSGFDPDDIFDNTGLEVNDKDNDDADF